MQALFVLHYESKQNVEVGEFLLMGVVGRFSPSSFKKWSRQLHRIVKAGLLLKVNWADTSLLSG